MGLPHQSHTPHTSHPKRSESRSHHVHNTMGDDTGKLIAVIGDEDTVTGFVLAGVGHRNMEGSNFLVVKEGETPLPTVEAAFVTLTSRVDVGILLINQHVANTIRHLLNDYTKPFPTVLEIPSKDHPYDADKDYIMVRVNQMLGHST